MGLLAASCRDVASAKGRSQPESSVRGPQGKGRCHNSPANKEGAGEGSCWMRAGKQAERPSSKIPSQKTVPQQPSTSTEDLGWGFFFSFDPGKTMMTSLWAILADLQK